MENFIFAANATMPVFLTIVIGFILRKVHLMGDTFAGLANEFVFKCALPINLFLSIAQMDFYADFDIRFCLFCFIATTVMFFGVWAFSFLLKDKSMIGAFAQASARSSAAILGIAFATNIYGDSGKVPMMIMAAVPFFNVYSVIILTLSPRKDENGQLSTGSLSRSSLKKVLINVIKNPMIIGILAGIPFSVLRISIPYIVDQALTGIGNIASPLALLVVGASFSGQEALTRIRPALMASAVKLLVLPAIFLPIAALLGFRNSEMVAILTMVGSPTTVVCYVMAKNMGGDSVLTSNTVLLATLLSSVSVTLWLFLLRSFGLL